MKNSLRIHKWTHNEFNIFILGVLTHPPYPWHNVPLMFSRWSEPGLKQFRQEAGLVGHGHARGLQRLYLALCRA